MSRTTPRERLYVDIPAPFMRMLDEMCVNGYSRTTIVMQAIEARYLLIQARKPTKGVASAPPELPITPAEQTVTYTHPDHPGRTFTQAEVDAWPD